VTIRRLAVISAAGLAVAGGAGAAIAATAGDEGKRAEENVLREAARDLDVSPGKLREALRDATAAQLDRELDRAVKAGDLTKQQAAEIKARRKDSGRVLGLGPGPRHGRGPGAGFHRHGPGFHPGGPGFPGRPARGGGPLEDVAKAIGISRAKLFSELRDGKTVAQIAKANGKNLDDVKKDVAASLKERLDRAVKDGELAEQQAKAMLEHLEDRLDRLGSARGFGPPPGPGGPGGFGGPPGGMHR
jgi:polyhydroxyalkanoate synthesis regulator phasin